MTRRAKLVLLCEDDQHEAFMRRFFERAGWHPRAFRVEKSPSGRGAGEQWVRERFPVELDGLRKSPVALGLAAMVDADRSEVEARIAAIGVACDEAGIPRRQDREPAAIFVPRRNIETWIAYLDGADVSEEAQYPKLPRERDCAPAVKALKGMCDRGGLREPAPPSLEATCTEYNTRLGEFGK